MQAIDCIDAGLLARAAPETPASLLAPWADPIKLGCQRFSIDTAAGIAALLAQAAHESGGFQHLHEDLFYSHADRILEVFGQGAAGRARFPNVASCAPYCRNPERLANYVYANRMGNGPPQSGDGWRHRGMGPFQITGKNNQQAFADAMGMELEAVPPFLQTINGGAMSMCWFFRVHGLENLAATPGIEDETRAINGGLNGLADRQRRFDAVRADLRRRGQ